MTIHGLQTTIGALIEEHGGEVKTGPFGTVLKASEYTEHGVPVISVGEIGHGEFRIHDRTPCVNETVTMRLPEYLLQKNDIVFARKGSVERSALVGDAQVGWFLGSDGIRLRLPETISSKFVRYWVASAETKAWLTQNSTGSTMASLNQATIKRLPIVLPSLGIQTEIAAILGALDDKIEVNRKTAATLEAMARALYRSWFVDFDPVHAKAAGRAPAHMDAATAALFPDSFGEDGLPEGWTEEPIIAQSDWVNGAAYKNMHFAKTPDALPVVKIAELKAGVTGNTKFTATDLGEKFRIGRGDLLFSWSGNPDTSIDAFIWALKDAWLNQHIFAVRPNGKMSKAALFTILKFYMPEFAEIARNKQTTGLGHITRKDLDAFSVRIAPPEIMEVLENEIEPMFDRYCLTLYENQTLATFRDTLLPRLMSGELSVGEAKEQVEAVA